MVSKKFKAGECVYCGKDGSIREHVIARKFFPVKHRDGLPCVISCAICNSKKSELENYMLSVMPFGGNHTHSSWDLNNNVKRRLDKNQKLYTELSKKRRDAWITDGAVIRPTLTIPLDGDKFENYFKVITIGLANYHWKIILPDSWVVQASPMTARGDVFFGNLMAMQGVGRVDRDLGDGIFKYSGMQMVDHPLRSIWHYQFYNGVQVSDSKIQGAGPSSTVWAMTSPKPDPLIFGNSDKPKGL